MYFATAMDELKDIPKIEIFYSLNPYPYKLLLKDEKGNLTTVSFQDLYDEKNKKNEFVINNILNGQGKIIINDLLVIKKDINIAFDIKD